MFYPEKCPLPGVTKQMDFFAIKKYENFRQNILGKYDFKKKINGNIL
jgi:hypothetical protein